MTIKEMRLAAGLRQEDILKDYCDPRLKRPDISNIENGIVDPPQRLVEHVRNLCKDFIKEDEETADRPCTHSQISLECRKESYLRIDSTARAAEVLRCFAKHGELTARQVKDILGKADMNYVRPRITELAQAGLLVECGKAKDLVTNRNVTKWRVAEICGEHSSPSGFRCSL